MSDITKNMVVSTKSNILTSLVREHMSANGSIPSDDVFGELANLADKIYKRSSEDTEGTILDDQPLTHIIN